MNCIIDKTFHVIQKTANISKEQILSQTRTKELVFARMLISCIMRLNGFTFAQIGELLNRNHSTIMHYLNNFDYYKKYDKEFCDFVERYEKECNQEKE